MIDPTWPKVALNMIVPWHSPGVLDQSLRCCKIIRPSCANKSCVQKVCFRCLQKILCWKDSHLLSDVNYLSLLKSVHFKPCRRLKWMVPLRMCAAIKKSFIPRKKEKGRKKKEKKKFIMQLSYCKCDLV